MLTPVKFNLDPAEFKQILFEDHKDFRPNLTPQQVMKLGAFGGTYFREIYSSILNQTLKDPHKEFSFFNDIDPKFLTSQVYNKKINFYPFKCGTSLEYWEQKNWIKSQDPYGWFQWYCRFYKGRRTLDDNRQITRWKNIAGPNGRFRKKSVEKKTDKIKQVLIHWAWWTH